MIPDGPVVHEPGKIKRVDMELGSPVGIFDKETDPNIPKGFTLNNNYPNPFNSITNISYELERRGNVCLEVYNVLGRKITTLFNGPQRLGSYQIAFDGKDLASGMYFLRMSVDGKSSTKKMVLIN